jgi:hypothetical protein
LLPFYMLLVSLATWLAILDFVVRPFHWWKTEHGLSGRRGGQPSETGHEGVEQGAREDGLAETDPEKPGEAERRG